MHRLHEAIRQKRPELWKNQSWILQNDNTPAHTSMLMREFLAKNKTVLIIIMIEEIKEKPNQELLVIPKNAFRKCSRIGKKRWHYSVISEGDKIVIDK